MKNARTGLWEPREGNRPGPPGHPLAGCFNFRLPEPSS